MSAIAPLVHVDDDPEERLNPVGDLLQQTEDIVYPDDLATVVPSDLENAALTVGEFADAFQVLIAPRRLLLDIRRFRRHGRGRLPYRHSGWAGGWCR